VPIRIAYRHYRLFLFLVKRKSLTAADFFAIFLPVGVLYVLEESAGEQRVGEAMSDAQVKVS
jgi:hypothetical protein